MQNRDNDKTTSVISKEDLQSAMSNNTIKGVLTRVYKLFMVSFGKDRTPVWNKLMDMYVNDPSNNVPNDRARQTSAKGNMKREYLGPQLSWPKYCEAMRFAKFKKLEIIFIATDENGQRMKVHEEINFDDIKDSDFADDIVDQMVQTVGDEPLFDSVDGSDARYAANNRSKRTFSTRGKDWTTIPQEEVQSIMDKNTVKGIGNITEDDIPF